MKRLSEKTKRIKELIHTQVDMGTYGLVELALIEIENEINSLKDKITNESEEIMAPGSETYDYPEYRNYVSVHDIETIFNELLKE